MKSKAIGLAGSLMVLAAVLFGAACSDSDNEKSPATTATPLVEVDSEGSTGINSGRLEDEVEALSEGDLTSAEIAGVLFVREEEKLARDVYQELAKSSSLPIFTNIGRSEQTHMDAVKVLIDQYDLKDPVLASGRFVNTDLQALYDRLVAQGRANQVEALKVGAAIEEIDLVDLAARMAETDEAAIKLVYENLMKGSRNHLRSFVSTLDRQGVKYTPIALSQAEFDRIIGGSIER
ncbi:MAG: DUF2202 domain-containing protein [Dehalococcoidia bacterium]